MDPATIRATGVKSDTSGSCAQSQGAGTNAMVTHAAAREKTEKMKPSITARRATRPP